MLTAIGPRCIGCWRQQDASLEVQRQIAEKWPADFDAAFAWLLSQPHVDKNRIGAGGGSCGVDNVVQLASRHPEIRSLVLLAGPAGPTGVDYLRRNAWIPLFTAAAADDEYLSDAPQLMRWFAEVTGNPRNKFVGFKDGRHATEIFAPHPELPKQIVAFYMETLEKHPATANAKDPPKATLVSEFWTAASEPGGATRAVKTFHGVSAPATLLGFTFVFRTCAEYAACPQQVQSRILNRTPSLLGGRAARTGFLGAH